jgi:hypothetical protein
MQIDQKEKYTLISADENSFSNFYNSFLSEEKKFFQENIIIKVSNNINISNQEILLFLDIATQKKKNGTSFVLVYTEIDVDNFPDNFNIVPTLQEAEDLIDMENMERELGF